MPGPVSDSVKQTVSHELLLRVELRLPSICWTGDCVLLAGQISDIASFTLNGESIGTYGMFPPALSPARLHPAAIAIPAASYPETSVIEARFWSHSPRRLGFEKNPLIITTAQDAKAFLRSQTVSLIFLPLACALGLTLLASMVCLFSRKKENFDYPLAIFVLFCVSGVVYLASFADVHYAFHSMRTAVAMRFVGKRVYDCAFFAFFLAVLPWRGWSQRVFAGAFWGTLAVCITGCLVAVHAALRAPTTYQAAAITSLVVFYTWKTKMAAAVAGCIASLCMYRQPGWLLRFGGFSFVIVVLYYDSLVFLSVPLGEYGSKFHYLAFAGFLAGMLVRRDAKAEAEVMVRKEGEAEIGRLARQVAHDIRSPLAALSMVSRNATKLAEDERLVLRAAGDRITAIADSLLRQTRKGAGGDILAPALRPVEILDVLENLAIEARIRWSGHPEIEIITTFSSQAYGLFLQANPVAFKRAVANILNNAADACGESGEVRIEIDDKRGLLQIAISDSGPGMPPSVIARIGQIGNTEGKAEGNGLGIYQAFNFARESGGSLTYTAAAGRGTTATFEMPRAEPPSWFTGGLAIHANQDVVVLDDDDSIHQVWRRRLTPVLQKSGGALHHHRDHQSFAADRLVQAGALCLVDYELVGTSASGLDLIRKLSITQRAVLVTSHAEDEDVQQRCEEHGISLLSKKAAGLVPIQPQVHPRDADIVILDDDPLVHTAWRLYANREKRNVLSVLNAGELVRIAEGVSKQTPIHVDFHLGDESENGLDVCRKLHEKGFTNLYLATGESSRNIPPCPWFKAVVGKGPQQIN